MDIDPNQAENRRQLALTFALTLNSATSYPDNDAETVIGFAKKFEKYLEGANDDDLAVTVSLPPGLSEDDLVEALKREINNQKGSN